MRQLLQIERNALHGIGINVNAIETATNAMLSATADKFSRSIDFGAAAANAIAIYKTRGAKAALRQDGVDSMETIADFVQLLFQSKPSWVYKCVKAAHNLDENPDLFTKFRQDVADGKTTMSIVAWNKYVKDGGLVDEDEDGDSDKPATLASFSLSKAGFEDNKGVSARVTADGTLHISGDSDKIPAPILQSLEAMAASLQQ